MQNFMRPVVGSLLVKTPLARPGQRIGIMGGSFNPPHSGHVRVSRTALRRLDLDQIWWLVTPGNPLKSHGGLADLEARISACRRLATDPREIVTGFEQSLGTRFTATTLAFLHRRYPGTHFVWVMGADSLAGFHRWKHWRSIAATTPLAVIDRPGWRWKALSSPAAHAMARQRVPEAKARSLTDREAGWCFVSSRLSDLSSTALRAQAPPDGSKGD
jgi:nicotinate-nucleotide adenylyltransferase